LPLCSHAQHDAHDLVSSPLDYLLHRYRLGHMTPALAEYAQHYFHGI
jgi:hypothetical protein